MKILNPQKSFYVKLKTLYDMEKQLEEALPKMAEASTDPELKRGFEDHLVETEGQSRRLEQIFMMIESEAQKHAGGAIRGLIADGNELMSAESPDALKDVLIAGAARSVEHYEMACYMGAIEEARALGLNEAVLLLEDTLEEEKNSEQKLTIAMGNNLDNATMEAETEVEE